MDKYATIGNPSDGMPSRLGTVLTSAPERGLDWALVVIENSNLMLDNTSLNNRSKSPLGYFYLLILEPY